MKMNLLIISLVVSVAFMNLVHAVWQEVSDLPGWDRSDDVMTQEIGTDECMGRRSCSANEDCTFGGTEYDCTDGCCPL
jgi:hypothetical protein